MICRFCNDRGCLCCAGERKRKQKELEQPIFVADTNNPQDLALLKQYFGADELDRIAKKTDGNMAEFSRQVNLNGALASLIQNLGTRTTVITEEVQPETTGKDEL